MGFSAFGGPIAHLGYFRDEFVTRRRWLSDEQFGEMIALAQATPGPASSKVGMQIGFEHGGLAGAFVAWFCFTMPSAAVMTAFAYGVGRVDPNAAWVHGLLLAAVAVVASAILGMVRTLAPDPLRLTFAVLIAAVLIVVPATGLSQLIAIVLGGVLGRYLVPKSNEPQESGDRKKLPLGSILALVAFFALLGLSFVLPGASVLGEFTRFYAGGALVFGGGHVVLPLLQERFVVPGLISQTNFLAGYAVAQVIPGPLFTFSAFLGALVPPVRGIAGAALALVAIFLPSALLLAGIVPIWRRIRGNETFRQALAGVNAAVVGILGAAFYSPILTSAVHDRVDAAIALAGFAMLYGIRLPPVIVVAGCAILRMSAA
ncbi:MAG: chromate efflux transporter [Vulcanimicrobiaceae bacterium]